MIPKYFTKTKIFISDLYKKVVDRISQNGGKVLIPLLGLSSLIWFLIRVIPKPSRASYPCMRVAAPMASSFVLWILGLAASVTAFKRMKYSYLTSSYFRAFLFLIIGIGFGVFAFSQSGLSVMAESEQMLNLPQASLTLNNPVGQPKGIFPGRVVWAHNPDATNENCDPMELGNSYFEPKNFDQDVVDNMVSKVIQTLSGTESNSEAWDAIFKFHNNIRGKGEVVYQSGEKVFLKLNATSAWSGNYNDSDLSKVYNSWSGEVNRYYGLSETSPAIILSVLRHLVNVVGVDQNDIYIGDPMKFIYKHNYEYLHAEFPDIHYLDHTGHTNLGRELAEKGTTPLIQYSDRGTVLVRNGTPIYEDNLYKIYEDMEYMINLPQMKGHVKAGATMFAKNHFGSHTRDGANHLHNGLMLPGEDGLSARPGFGLYRVQVDLMGHEILGKKNLIYLMDALWGTDHELNPPHKWQMAPFNNDWTSSVFASLDPVAIESVGYDFIRTEFTKERYAESYEDVVDVIQMDGVCDYLRQAADESFWPEGIEYDPENDGIKIGSLGVHEHWNDSENMQYSKNLGIGEGIELIKVGEPAAILEAPSLLNASIINEVDVEIVWTDNSSDEIGFIIERKENSINADFEVLDTVSANLTSYLDDSEKNVTSYFYRIKSYNDSMESEYSDSVLVEGIVLVGVENKIISSKFRLNQNYPNPFNPSTTISFTLKEKSDVKLVIYDLLGNLVKELVDENMSSGTHSIKWNSKNYLGYEVVSGIYIYRIAINSSKFFYTESKKMTLLR